ncbi:hypothetical protein FRC08_007931 [Ceratobasidium sp. 394]|nr:hypothetical protein FRC08_007931 [Ceratobasidium sp. 394]
MYWKKYMACVRRSKHTSGGDGDVTEQDEAHDENEPDPGSEVLSDEDERADGDGKAADKEKKMDRTGGSAFTEAQPDAFEQSELFDPIFAVAKDNPKVIKQEEFDQAREFSDSETTNTTKSTKSDGTLQTSVRLAESQRPLNERRERREEQADADRKADRHEERQIQQRRLEIDEQNFQAVRGHQARRLDLDERELKLEEEERREKQWQQAEALLNHPNEIFRCRERGS